MLLNVVARFRPYAVFPACLFAIALFPVAWACETDTGRLDDQSCERYVGPDFPLSSTGYVPDGLEPIPSDPFLVTDTEILAEPQAFAALASMSLDFFDALQFPISVVSGYRSYSYQLDLSLRARACVRDGYCALPWRSEHQTGLAFDLFEFSDEQTFFRSERNAAAYRWLNTHARRYGFIQTYSKWRNVDGYHVEPWHWRYVGVALATRLWSLDRSPAQEWRMHPLERSLLDDYILNTHRYGPFVSR